MRFRKITVHEVVKDKVMENELQHKDGQSALKEKCYSVTAWIMEKVEMLVSQHDHCVKANIKRRKNHDFYGELQLLQAVYESTLLTKFCDL